MRRVTTVVGLSIVLAGCATLAAAADGMVGTTRWVTGKYPVSVCDAPMDIRSPAGRSCKTAKAGTALTIQRPAFVYNLNVPIPNGYFVTGGGLSRYIGDYEAFHMDSQATRKEAAKAKGVCDSKGGVNIGMTREQVYASCWGHPRTINQTLTARGKHEQLVYGGGYLYIDNGVLTSIQTSR